jgi:hypothetical protein
MKRYFLPAFIIFVIFIASCYYDNEEALYPSYNSTCDTSNVTFSGTIAPILYNNCLACHSNAASLSAGNNIRLENFADVVSQITTLIASIKHTGPLPPMPKNGGKLKDCSLIQFDIWVKKGMLNN